MTHEEIQAAIGRLRELGKRGNGYTASSAISAVIDGPWIDGLIGLLEQADTVSGGKWMKLPKDADGVPIRINDKMTLNCSGRVVEVAAVGECGFYYADGEMSLLYYSEAACCHHYHSPTIEDVMVEYLNECLSHESELRYATNKGRERAWRDMATTFAEKIREAMGSDQ